MLRFFVLLALAGTLSGCDRLADVQTSRSDKINRAVPVPAALQTAQTLLFASVEGSAEHRSKVFEQHKQLLELRALSCSAGIDIGRFDSVDTVKRKLINRDCFAMQDTALADWVGAQRVGIALQRPAIAPLTDLPPKMLLPAQEETTTGVYAARQANVLVLQGARQKLSVVQVPDGKPIATFKKPEGAYRAGSLSPNGHLLALPVGARTLEIVEVQSGDVLWHTEQFSEVIAWLPEVQAVLLAKSGTSQPMLLDGRTGQVGPYPASEARLTWSTPMPGKPGQHLVGTAQGAALVEHARSAEGALGATLLREWRLSGHGVTSSPPFTMADGRKLVFLSNRDLAWIDLESGQLGSWAMSSINGQGYAKLSETTILFDSVAHNAMTRIARVLDIESGTTSTVVAMQPDTGLLLPLGQRPGFVRRGVSAVAVYTAVETESPQDIDKLLAEAHLERQLALLKTQTSAVDPSGRGLPATVGGGFTPSPMLRDVPSDAPVAMVGVYEAASTSSRRPGEPRQTGNVRITLSASPVPVVLVLSNYEPVRWVIHNQGRRIAAILLSGNHDSTVVGPGTDRVLRIGSAYAYSMDSAGHLQLRQIVARYVANPIQTFQGKYAASEFAIPGR